MKSAEISFVSVLGICASLIVLADAKPAAAQNCYPTHSAGFARIRGFEPKALTQAAADMEVRALFGPRIELCEEGAYKAFMDSFKEFSAQAMRASKNSREKLLRLAIAVVRQAPTMVPVKELKTMSSHFRQVRSDLNATADDVGFATTPLLQQLLDALVNLGPPKSATGTTVTVETPPPTTTSPSPSTGTPTGGVQPIRVPADPLPPWAVIKLYEMRDHVKAQDLAAIQIKLQDIINWIENKTRDQ